MSTTSQNLPTSPAQGQMLVYGSINEDIALQVSAFPSPGQTVKAHGSARATGGKGANQAAAAALSGARVHMIGAVGDDPAGEAARLALQSAGADTALVRTDPTAPSGTAYIYVRSDGENTIVVDPGANAGEFTGEVPEECFEEVSWCLLSLEVPEEHVMRFAARSQAHGVKVALNASPALDLALKKDLVDVLIVNEGEAGAIAGEGWQALDNLAGRLGVEAVVVTQGGDGATVFHRDTEPVHVPADKVNVRDTTGCGDAFAGVMVAALTDGSTYTEAVGQATRFAGRAAEHPGAMAAYFELHRD